MKEVGSVKTLINEERVKLLTLPRASTSSHPSDSPAMTHVQLCYNVCLHVAAKCSETVWLNIPVLLPPLAFINALKLHLIACVVIRIQVSSSPNVHSRIPACIQGLPTTDGWMEN